MRLSTRWVTRQVKVRFYYGGVLVEGGSMGHLLILLVIRVIFPDPDRHQWHADPEP